MFKENKYTKLYYQIIDRAKTRVLLSYNEKHHIIPRCLGGTDAGTNIVELTAREHFICHLLLTKMSDVNGIKFAFVMMTRENPKQKRDYRITSKSYDIAKRLNSEASSIRSIGKSKHNVGKKKYHDPKTQEEFFIHPKDAPDDLVAGMSDKTKTAMLGKIKIKNISIIQKQWMSSIYPKGVYPHLGI